VEDAGVLASDRPIRAGDRDEELALAASSDPDAFGLIYERHRTSVYRYLRARTSTDDEASELTAITFERALAAIPRYRSIGGGVVAWLLRIARNAAIDAGRRAAIAALDTDVIDGARTASPETLVIRDEERHALIAAVRVLPEVQREAIVLRYAAGLTARQIGEVIGKSDVATQKLLSRALATIRENYRVDA
jgi:RNA polymerase sigma-70 factor (ECF subfamily)